MASAAASVATLRAAVGLTAGLCVADCSGPTCYAGEIIVRIIAIRTDSSLGVDAIGPDTASTAQPDLAALCRPPSRQRPR